MAEYIDREKIREAACDGCMHRTGKSQCDFPKPCKRLLSAFMEAEQEDVAPVVHGEWEWFDEKIGTPIDGYDRDWGWRCSVCKDVLCDEYDDPDKKPKMKYCSACGAKLDGGE